MDTLQEKPRVSRQVGLIGALVIAAMIVSVAISVVAMREKEIESWRRQMSSLSLILSEQTAQTIFAAYLVLDSITERVRQARLTDQASFRAKMATPEIFNMLREEIHGLPVVDVTTLVAANGDNINFSRAYPVPPINLAERDYFKAHLENPQLGDFISQPVRNKGNGKWTFYISRRLNDAQGNFMGLALVGISVDVITSFYERVARDLGEGATISLFRNDLTLLTRWPHKDELIGAVNRTGSAYEVVEVMKKTEGVLLRNTPRFSTGEAVLRLTAVRRMERYPLTLAIVVTDDLFLSSWRRSTMLIAGVTAAGVLALLIGLLALVRNLAQREADMAAMERLKSEAESANLAKSKFLATMSHEIRTPMNGMLGMAQLLLMPGLSEEERYEFARTILNSGQTLLTLLNDILDLSKVEAGKLDLAHTVFDPQHVLKETSALFAELALAKGLKIDTDWQATSGCRYQGDPLRIRQMLSNLLSNAIKFTTHGVVRLEACEIVRNEKQALLEFAVTDSGIGIAPDKQALLFQPFSQADSSTTREYGGSGLGLSIVRSLAKLMGGDVGLASEAGKGSRFSFRIRVDIQQENEESRQQVREARAEPKTATTTGLAGHILVVEDNLTNRKVIEALLRKMGIQATSVENGQQAVDAILQGMPPDLILMDIQMPVMDGYTATQHIRRWEKETRHAHLPIIALTAGAFEEDRQNCLAAGMDDFLTKPIEMNKLASILEKWMGKKAPIKNKLV